MALIYETKNFLVEAPEKPHITRTDGGHIRIIPKRYMVDRTEMLPKEAIEFIRLTIVVGEAMKQGLAKRGINLARINYQDNGNWAFKTGDKPRFHLHLYGRIKNEKYQKFPEALFFPDRLTGFYDNFEPLNHADTKEIRIQIIRILKEKKYKDSNWGF